MTTDFKASQVQTSKVIVTGSFAGGTANQLLIYNHDADDSGAPNQGVIDPAIFDTTAGIGTDVFVFVSGAIGSRGLSDSYGIAVIGGDLHISGNLTIDGSGGGGGGGNDYWQSTTSDIIFNTGSIRQGASVTIDLPTTNSVIFSSQGSARIYGGLSNAVISSDASKIRNTTGFAGDVRLNTMISDIYSEIDSDGSGLGPTGWNIIAASAFNTIDSGSQVNAIIGSAYVNITSGSFLNSTLAAGDLQNTFPTVLDNAAGSAIIAGGPNIISSSDGISVINSAIIGSNWIITSSFTYAIGDTVNPAEMLISASRGVDITGQTKFYTGLSGSLTQLTNGISYLIAGTNVTITSESNGQVTISSTGGGGGGVTCKQHAASYTTTISTAAVLAGQFSWVPADYVGLTSVSVRAIMSTDGTANHTGSLQIYNLTSGSYLDLVDTPTVSTFFEITSSIPTLLTSSNLLTGITNFDNSSTAIYEVRVSGSSANNTIIGGVELVFS